MKTTTRLLNLNKQAGVSMLETLLVLPIIVVLGFGIVHLGLVFQAQSNLEYAALMAARMGASNGLDIQSMEEEVEKRMDASRFGSALGGVPAITIQILNPTQQMFNSCGLRPTYNTNDCDVVDLCEIPLYGLSLRSQAQLCDGASIQDANILRIRVTYSFNSGVPFLNRITFATRMGSGSDPNGLDVNQPSLSGGTDGEAGVQISAVATVRMQVPARRTFDNTDNISG